MLNYSNKYRGQNLLVISYSAPNLNQRFSFSFYEFIEGAGLFTDYLRWCTFYGPLTIKRNKLNKLIEIP
mgnify:CR=1 FL=1